MKHFLSVSDLDRDEILKLLSLAKKVKLRRKVTKDLEGKHLVLLFEKPSLRTRVSFEVAIKELYGHCFYLGGQEVGLGVREAIKDMAMVLSRYVHGCIIRTFKQENLLEFSRYAKVTVINALTDSEHPCQVMADLLTIEEKLGRLTGFKLAYIGDGNNVCHSLIQASSIIGFDIAIASPKGYEPKEEILTSALRRAKESKANIEVYNQPEKAIKDATFIYTDVWASMGYEKEKKERRKVFKKFQINEELLKKVKGNYYIMHCLPCHRGEEITDEVIDSDNSIVIDQAENRLHMHKAILISLLG